MLKATIVLLAFLGLAVSLKFGDPGTPGVTFEQQGTFFEDAIVDESVVSPGSRVVVATITDVTGEPTVSPGIGGVGGGGFGNGPLNPEIEGSGDSYSLSIEVPEHVFAFPGAPDPRYFVEVFEGFGFPGTLTVIFKNAQTEPLPPFPGGPGDPEFPGGPGGPEFPGGPVGPGGFGVPENPVPN